MGTDDLAITATLDDVKVVRGLNSITAAVNRSAMKMQNVNRMIDTAVNKIDFSKSLGLPKNFDTKFSNLNEELKTLQVSSKQFKGSVLGLPKDLGSKFTDINKEVAALGSTSVMTGKHIDKSVNAALGRMSKELDNQRVPFAGYAMSIMFFGMALKQMSLQVQRFGTKAFNDVMHSVEGTVTQSDYLNASMMYLGFTIGQAFEPILAFLIPIIDAVANWVSEHEKLTAGILVAAVAIGTLLALAGALKLAWDGFQAANAIAGLFKVSDAATSTTTALDATKTSYGLLQKTLALGLLAIVAYRIFGEDNKTPSFKDWMTNLGLAAAAGFMLGGPWGAGVAFVITAIIMVSKEAVKEALKTVEGFRKAQQKLLAGDLLNAEEAYKVAFSGTIKPEAMNLALAKEAEQVAKNFENITPQLFTPDKFSFKDTQGAPNSNNIVIQNLNVTTNDNSELLRFLNATAAQTR